MMIPQASDALAELHRRDLEAGIDPLAPSPTIKTGDAPALQPLELPPPPWSDRHEADDE
jgi:hypothetical protein